MLRVKIYSCTNAAHKWRHLAASRASAENREQFAEARDALAAKMTRAQIADAKKRASEWHAAFDARQEEGRLNGAFTENWNRTIPLRLTAAAGLCA